MARLFDRVKFNVSGTPNQGTCTVGTRTTSSFYLPAEVSSGSSEVFYLLVNASNDEEHGIGTVASDGSTVSRDTVLASIIGGVIGTTKINVGASSVMGFTSPAEAFKSLRNSRSVTGSTDTIVDLDAASTITYNRATSLAVSIAQAGTSGAFKKGWYVYVKNINAGDVTITPSTSTIGDTAAATLVLKQGTSAIIVSDGTNYTAYIFHRALWASTTTLSATEQGQAKANLAILSAPQHGITLTTGVLNPSSDVSGATTMYCTPGAGGNQIPLWNGTNFVMTPTSELSQATSDATKSPYATPSNACLDALAWNDSGTPRCTRGHFWANNATVTMTIASPAVMSQTGHGMVAGSPVRFTTTGALPTGLTAGTIYYVIAAGLTANAYEVSATVGGSAINTSGSQSGTHTAFAGSDSTRGTGLGSAELQQVNGVWVNKYDITNGPLAGYGTLIGTVRSDSSAQLRNTKLFQWVSNAYALSDKFLLFADIGASHAYSSTTIQQWGASGSPNTAAQLDVVACLGGRLVVAEAICNVQNTGTAEYPLPGIGFNTNVANSAQCISGPSMFSAGAAFNAFASYLGYLPIGRNVLYLVHSVGGGSGTTTWIAGPVVPATFRARVLN